MKYVLTPVAFSLGLVALAVGCGGTKAGASGAGPSSSDAGSSDAALSDAAGSPDGGDAGASPYADECADAAVPPETIECTGLYENLATKEVAAGVRPYAPAIPLWADNAEKQRWIYLPPGTTIDATNPSEWTFPVGTKVWKEFSKYGKRVETRLFEKTAAIWVYTTYAWNADDSEATQSGGGDIPFDGGTYHIPTPSECFQCHRGRTDRILGFEQVSLGLDGATGLPLSELVAEKLVVPAPSLTKLTVGDDGTGVSAAPMSWIHINCGVSCHNDNANSTAYGSGMNLRLDPTMLDGQSSVNFDQRTTTIGITANNPMWNSEPRIVAGDPSHSLLVQLITSRGTDNPAANQMPPIATSLVDVPDTQNVIAWITKMAPEEGDGGEADASPNDAGQADASPSDSGGTDATPSDAGGADATPSDGGAGDAP